MLDRLGSIPTAIKKKKITGKRPIMWSLPAPIAQHLVLPAFELDLKYSTVSYSSVTFFFYPIFCF
jgi:hypothetical protein